MLALGAAFALATGMSYASGNQRQYLLHALNDLNPALFAADWFTQNTTPVHPAFTWIIRALALAGPLPVALSLANGFMTIAFVFTLYTIIRRFFDRAVVVLALTLVMLTFAPVNCLGWSYVLSCYLQPSTIGGVGFLAAAASMIHRRYLVAAGFVLVTGVFHAGYLTWLVVIVAAVVVVDRRVMAWRQRAALAVSLAVGIGIHLPLLLAMRVDPLAHEAARILHTLYTPQHFQPASWSAASYVEFVSVLVVGAVAAGFFPPVRGVNHPSVTILLTVSAIVFVGLFFTTVIFIPQVASLFPFRMVPFLRLAALVFVANALAVCATGAARFTVRNLVLCFALFAGLWGGGITGWGLSCVLKLTLLLTPAAFWRRYGAELRRRIRPAVVISLAPAVCVLLSVLLIGWIGSKRKDLFGRSPPPGEAALYSWCRAHTSRDDVFVIPPLLGGFRLGAQRCVVVDWRCIPVVPNETIAWRNRLADLTGGSFQSIDDLVRGFERTDARHARRLAAQFGAHYLVIETAVHAGDLTALPCSFRGADYAVYDLSGPASRTGKNAADARTAVVVMERENARSAAPAAN